MYQAQPQLPLLEQEGERDRYAEWWWVDQGKIKAANDRGKYVLVRRNKRPAYWGLSAFASRVAKYPSFIVSYEARVAGLIDDVRYTLTQIQAPMDPYFSLGGMGSPQYRDRWREIFTEQRKRDEIRIEEYERKRIAQGKQPRKKTTKANAASRGGIPPELQYPIPGFPGNNPSETLAAYYRFFSSDTKTTENPSGMGIQRYIALVAQAVTGSDRHLKKIDDGTVGGSSSRKKAQVNATASGQGYGLTPAQVQYQPPAQVQYQPPAQGQYQPIQQYQPTAPQQTGFPGTGLPSTLAPQQLQQPPQQLFGPPQGQPFGPPQGQTQPTQAARPVGSPRGQQFGPPQGQPFGPPQGQPFGPPQGQPQPTQAPQPLGSPRGQPQPTQAPQPLGSPRGNLPEDVQGEYM
jgi:hypothetical protein